MVECNLENGNANVYALAKYDIVLNFNSRIALRLA